MFTNDHTQGYEEALKRTLDNTPYGTEILEAIHTDATELQAAANTVSIIFLDHELAHELSKYSEFLFEIVRKYARD
jgi:hypothetical protein